MFRAYIEEEIKREALPRDGTLCMASHRDSVLTVAHIGNFVNPYDVWVVYQQLLGKILDKVVGIFNIRKVRR